MNKKLILLVVLCSFCLNSSNIDKIQETKVNPQNNHEHYYKELFNTTIRMVYHDVNPNLLFVQDDR